MDPHVGSRKRVTDFGHSRCVGYQVTETLMVIGQYSQRTPTVIPANRRRPSRAPATTGSQELHFLSEDTEDTKKHSTDDV